MIIGLTGNPCLKDPWRTKLPPLFRDVKLTQIESPAAPIYRDLKVIRFSDLTRPLMESFDLREPVSGMTRSEILSSPSLPLEEKRRLLWLLQRYTRVTIEAQYPKAYIDYMAGKISEAFVALKTDNLSSKTQVLIPDIESPRDLTFVRLFLTPARNRLNRILYVETSTPIMDLPDSDKLEELADKNLPEIEDSHMPSYINKVKTEWNLCNRTY